MQRSKSSHEKVGNPVGEAHYLAKHACTLAHGFGSPLVLFFDVNIWNHNPSKEAADKWIMSLLSVNTHGSRYCCRKAESGGFCWHRVLPASHQTLLSSDPIF